MHYHAEGDECIWMKCNENVKNASKCMNMHLNAYGEKQHHFREKTTLIPLSGGTLCRPSAEWQACKMGNFGGRLAQRLSRAECEAEGVKARPVRTGVTT
jgi:hypothetical protein